MFNELTTKLDSWIEMGIPGYDCIVYHNGECVYRHQNGYSDRENKIKMNGTEKYNIYSCSKPITCTAALQLYEKGLYKLDDKLSDYMPEFETMYVKTDDGIKKAENSITIKDLFCMTAGFSYDICSPMIELCKKETNGKCQTRELMKYLAKEPLLFEPGERYEYSLCHDVLAAFVEVLSDMRFGEYVKKHIFEPLGMNNSTFLLDDSELNTICPQYTGEKIELRERTIDYKFGSEYESGGAGCISTVDDYIKFLEALRSYKLLKPETVKLMITDRLTDEQKCSYWPKETHGYGLGVRCPMGDKRYIDFGWGGAAGAHLTIDTQNEISIYFATHILSSPAQGLRSKIYRFVRAEMIDNSEFESLYKELKDLYDYNLTY